jgi:hypothetical protein
VLAAKKDSDSVALGTSSASTFGLSFELPIGGLLEPLVPPEFWGFNGDNTTGVGTSRMYRLVRIILLALDRLGDVDLLVLLLDAFDGAFDRSTGETRRDSSVLVDSRVMRLVLSSKSPLLDVSASGLAGDIQGRVNGWLANRTTPSTTHPNSSPIAQANMLTLIRTGLLPPLPR